MSLYKTLSLLLAVCTFIVKVTCSLPVCSVGCREWVWSQWAGSLLQQHVLVFCGDKCKDALKVKTVGAVQMFWFQLVCTGSY